MSSVDNISLYSLRKQAVDLDHDFIIFPEFICPSSSVIELGPADIRFSKGNPSIVELLVIIPSVIDVSSFSVALRQSLDFFFPSCGGRRLGSSHGRFSPGGGVRFSAIKVDSKFILSQPPAESLFDPIVEGQLLNVRLSLSRDGKLSAISMSFDHALCDIAGISLVLMQISGIYDGEANSTTKVHYDRAIQAEIIPAEIVSKKYVASIDGTIPTFCKQKRKGNGGTVCVEWSYSGSSLSQVRAQ